MILTKNLKILRLKHELTQKDMSKLLNISIVAYRQKENNIRQFTLGEAKIISEIFNESIEAIFFEDKVHEKGTKNHNSA